MNTRIVVLFFIACATVFTACKKNNDAPTTSLTTSLNIINAGTDTVNFYLNGTRLNSNSNLYPDYTTGYFGVSAGAPSFQIKKLFNPATNTVQQLFSLPLKLDPANRYSLFIAGETQAQAFTTVDS